MPLRADPRLASGFYWLLNTLAIAPKFIDKRGEGREIINLRFSVDRPNGAVFFTTKDRAEDVNYVGPQLWWYSKGKQELGGIQHYNPKMWARITDRQQVDLHSNYGEYVFVEKQLETVIKRLTKDPASRQAVILFNRPEVNATETHDHICTTSLQFLVRNTELVGIATMRSNELWNGFRYDVAFFTFLLDYVKAELNGAGVYINSTAYYHNVGSFHVYGDIEIDSISAEALVFQELLPNEGPTLIKRLPKIEESLKDGQEIHLKSSSYLMTIVDLLKTYEPSTHPRP